MASYTKIPWLYQGIAIFFVLPYLLLQRVTKEAATVLRITKQAAKGLKLQTKTVPSEPTECSSEDLYHNPLHFTNCTRRHESPSCQPRQTENWDHWVADRYNKYDGKCVTPELMTKTGEMWAISGRGSSLKATAEIRALLDHILHDPSLGINTFLDCPCGDWLWIQAVNLTGVQYFGADITQKTVDENTKCFERDDVHFHHLDWSCTIPPPVDLIMARDVLFHLSTSVVLDILRHINRSGAKYLLSTTSFNTTSKVDNFKRDAIDYRDINLYGPPFNLPKPVMTTDKEDVKQPRHMALWKLPIVLDE